MCCEVRLDRWAGEALSAGRAVRCPRCQHQRLPCLEAGGRPGRQHLTDAQLLALIRAIHKEFKGTYGSPRMIAEIRGRGFTASKERVEHLMRENGIRARHKRRYKATTGSRHGWPVAENLLDRNFAPAAPNQAWSADMTYIWTDEGWLYLGLIQPRGDQLVDQAAHAGGHRDRRADHGQVPQETRARGVHHSDRGSQYASHAFQASLAEYGMICSMSRKGNCWDNAPTESFFNSLKNERVHGTRYATREAAMADLFDYIKVFYNWRRRHSALKGKSPTQFLQDWISAQHEQNLAA
jgi:putative transposase